MAHKYTLVHGVFQAYKDISWQTRDDDYFHPPYSIHDRRYGTTAHDDFRESCRKRYSNMLGDFCGYPCYVVWAHEKRIVCDHNRSCCLACGEVWVRFDAPDDHSTHNGLTVCGENTKCTRQPLQKVADVLNEYRSLDRRLEAAGLPLAQLRDKDNGVTTYPCTTSCYEFWTREMVCGHNMKFCHRCREHFTSTHTACPYHADGIDSRHGESSMVALTTHRAYNFIDEECDRECTYLHEKKVSSYCRHSMARCKDCGNVWDGNAQCTCYLDDKSFDHVDSTESDSDETNYGSDSSSQGFVIDTKLLTPSHSPSSN